MGKQKLTLGVDKLVL